MNTIIGILIPFLGTTLGSACVLFMRSGLRDSVRKALTGFAGGVMTAASIWSLLLPSLETGGIVPGVAGFWLGILFLLLLDLVVPHLHMNNTSEGPSSSLKRTTKLLLAVTLHNIPEGMAVGVVLAGWLTGSDVSFAAALALSIGIAIQNFPEGAIISMPLHSEGLSRKRAFFLGTMSGIVEPVASIVTILFSGIVVSWLPVLLSFAAGAMIYVVVEELIPEMSEGTHSNIGTLLFAAGFSLMMILDVILA